MDHIPPRFPHHTLLHSARPTMRMNNVVHGASNDLRTDKGDLRVGAHPMTSTQSFVRRPRSRSMRHRLVGQRTCFLVLVLVRSWTSTMSVVWRGADTPARPIRNQLQSFSTYSLYVPPPWVGASSIHRPFYAHVRRGWVGSYAMGFQGNESAP